jgi:hypothetical protein
VSEKEGREGRTALPISSAEAPPEQDPWPSQWAVCHPAPLSLAAYQCVTYTHLA